MVIERIPVRGTNCYVLQGIAGVVLNRPGSTWQRASDHRQDDRPPAFRPTRCD